MPGGWDPCWHSAGTAPPPHPAAPGAPLQAHPHLMLTLVGLTVLTHLPFTPLFSASSTLRSPSSPIHEEDEEKLSQNSDAPPLLSGAGLVLSSSPEVRSHLGLPSSVLPTRDLSPHCLPVDFRDLFHGVLQACPATPSFRGLGLAVTSLSLSLLICVVGTGKGLRVKCPADVPWTGSCSSPCTLPGLPAA